MRFPLPVLAALAASMLVAPALAAQQEIPRRLDFSTDTAIQPVRQESSRALRNAFVRNQTLLGLTVYGPSFGVMVGNDGLTSAAGYLVMAGGSFFASAEYARRREITEGKLVLSTAMAWRTAASGLWLAYELDGEGKSRAAATLLGGLGGTVAGVIVGGGLSGGEATAMVFGHDLAYASAVAVSFAIQPDLAESQVLDDRHVVAWTTAGLLGYYGGHRYARRSPYNITVGDVRTMWLGAAIGALGASTFLANSDPSDQTTALTLLGGALVGTFAADRFLVRRYDHSRGEGGFVALGALAGGVMGVGVGVLVAGEAQRDGALTFALATIGALGGVALSERFLQTSPDAGRSSALGRLTFDPMGAVAAAARTPGRHTLLRFTF